MTETMTRPEPQSLTPAREVRTTTCVLDCPDACSLAVTVEGTGDAERVVALAGGTDHPTTAGFLCSKVSHFHRRVHHPGRLLTPLRRSGPKGSGEFEPISWDEALSEVATRLGEIRQRWGGEAILPYHYGGSNGEVQDDFVDQVFFARLGASRLGKTLCAVPTTLVALGMYGKMPGVAYEDFEQARFILLWGANPKAAGIHLVPFLKRARAAGAKLAFVDPVRTFSAQEADLHLAPRPGTDLPIALAMIQLWREAGRFDHAFLARQAEGLEALLAAAERWPVAKAAAEAGVAARDVERLAELYAESSPAVLRCGWGVERNRNGGAAVAAILAFPALLGKFGVPGGGYTMSSTGAAKLEREQALEIPPWQTRVLNMTRLAALLEGELAPPIKALFVYNANPVATVPDQVGILRGLAREDLFTVVSEQVMTDTARFADVVLPATTFLEHGDLRIGYGAYVVGGAPPVIRPCGEARSNVELFAALGRAMGFEDAAFRLTDAAAFTLAAKHLRLEGAPADLGKLAAGRAHRYDFPGERPIQFGTVFPRTDDGKVHLAPAVLGKDPFQYLPLASPFPLALVSPASARILNSTLGEVFLDELTVTINPEDAAARELRGGETVRVYNELGEVHCRLVVSGHIRPGVALMPKGAWRRSSANGLTSTALCPPTVQRVGEAACYNDARVEIELSSSKS